MVQRKEEVAYAVSSFRKMEEALRHRCCVPEPELAFLLNTISIQVYEAIT
jgi:hypothetical protein